MLQAVHLDVRLQQKTILSDISMSVEPGEIVSVLGPNGAGKSTLLKALSGDLAQAHSLVRLNGRFLADYDVMTLAQLRSVMPQSVQLDFPFLVSEVIEMSLVKPMTALERAVYVDKALTMFDVLDLKARNYLTLSGGEQQRVQLARVMAQITLQTSKQNRYLFLDECTANLDLAHQHQVFEVVQKIIAEHNVSALMVLHDLNLAAQYSNKLILMQEGKVIKQGSVDQVLTAQQISKVYGYEVEVIQHHRGWPMVIPA